jgi:hypothetical protein
VLDYGAASQISLLDRVTERFSSPAEARTSLRRWWLLLAGIAVGRGLAARAYRRARRRPASPLSRTFVELRHAYDRAGWLPAADATAREIVARTATAPGGADAAAAVRLYLRGRFSDAELSDADADALRRHVRAARASLRRRTAAAD